jgi:D-amino-acid dehydrogenase
MLEVTVIGGGLVGASAAYRLLDRGARVTVVDRCDLGQATAAGAGILPPLDHFASGHGLLPLIRAAREYYPELLGALRADGATDVGYQQAGALHVATSDRELEALPVLARQWEEARDAGFPHVGKVTLVDGRAARRLMPALGAAVLGALHSDGAGRVDGRRLLAALRSAVLKRGGRWLHLGAELAIERERVHVILSDGEVLAADAVVLAAGSWSHALGQQLGLHLPVRPQRGQLIHLELSGERTEAWPTILGFGTHYILGFPDGRVVVGATREELVQHDWRVTAGGVHAVLDATLALAPGLADATLLETRVGFRPVSADGLPLLGPSAQRPSVFLATGHAGYGLEVGPYSGALVADLVLSQPVAVDLAPFRADRFGAGLAETLQSAPSRT